MQCKFFLQINNVYLRIKMYKTIHSLYCCCIVTEIHLTTSLIQPMNEHLETIVRGKNQIKENLTNLKVLHINAMMNNL